MSTLSTTASGLWLGPDIHSNRPATPLGGTLYVCTTHSKIEKYASGAWADWATLGGGGGSSVYTGVKVYRTAAYSLANATVTAVPWDTEEWDTDGFHDNVTNNARLTVPTGKAGKYMVSASISSSVGLSGRYIVVIQKNGTDVRGGAAEAPVGSSGSIPGLNVACEVDLAVGDYVQVVYYQDAGSTKAADLTKSGLSMHLIG